MTSANLANLAKIGQLKKEPPDGAELEGLQRAGRNKLKDARNASNSFESRFDLAYNAAHALSLAALRWHGYRSENRYLVFQVLPHTLGIEDSEWRVLATCHERRNRAEYQGILEADERLLAALVEIAARLLAAVEALGAVKKEEPDGPDGAEPKC
ncbi:MAG: hypothetical protein EPO20_13315 [Betaproteobacteria bacterium]|nr:MAG: hypothetical protein EPO20_13315 [Betaproteobacteria bacterium]